MLICKKLAFSRETLHSLGKKQITGKCKVSLGNTNVFLPSHIFVHHHVPLGLRKNVTIFNVCQRTWSISKGVSSDVDDL